jgi:AmmeMemoRadiSam system protein A
MSPLSRGEQKQLLEIARRAIVEALERRRTLGLQSLQGALAERRGAFVTLRLAGQLKGCVGQPVPLDPLAETVASCAVLAAREDTRFTPVTPEQIAALTIEISALSPMNPVRPEEIEIGKHGIWIEMDRRRGLLLPQVAIEHHLSREVFLVETCLKAGLPRDAWKRPEARIFAFTAEVFSEDRESSASEAAPEGSRNA